MKLMVLRLAATLSTFALGVAAAMPFLTHYLPSPSHSSAEEFKALITPQEPSCFPGLSVKTQVMGKLSFFPPGVFSANEWGDQFRADWYSKHLIAMNEPRLYFPDNSEQESYRFIWLRTFHHPIGVRIWSSGGTAFISVKELNGAGGYKPGRLIVNQTQPITMNHWNEFHALLEQACYWKLKTEDNGISGKDGAQWILEGVKKGRYHVVDRWSPESGNYREVCLFLLKLSGLGINASSRDLY